MTNVALIGLDPKGHRMAARISADGNTVQTIQLVESAAATRHHADAISKMMPARSQAGINGITS